MHKRLITAAIAAVVAFAAVAPQLAHAQEKNEAASQEAPAAVEPEAIEVSTSEVAAFSEAALQISEIRRNYTEEMRQAQQMGNQQMMQGLIEEIRLQAREIIDGIPEIDQRRYSEIAMAMRADKDLRARVLKVMRKAAEAEAPKEGGAAE